MGAVCTRNANRLRRDVSAFDEALEAELQQQAERIVEAELQQEAERTATPGFLRASGLICCAGMVVLLVLVASIARRLASGGGPSEHQPTRLRVANGCDREPMWVAYMGRSMLDPQNVRIGPGQFFDFTVPDSGLSTTRYWPKWRCAADGGLCSIGDSGGPGQECDRHAGCAPPLDTKFEATFGTTGAICNTTARQYLGCDFVDVSLKDGYTVPFKLAIKGDCNGNTARETGTVHQVVDCSNLSVDDCPSTEDLGLTTDNLKAVNPKGNQVAGCYSPCSKLTYPEWTTQSVSTERLVRDFARTASAPYCCPNAEVCKDGVIQGTRYVQAVHAMCPGVNGYPYDNGMGVGTCPAGTKYEMTFYCPTNSAAPEEKAKPKEPAFEEPSTRLRIVNHCDEEPMWIAYMAKDMVDAQNFKLEPMKSHDFIVPNNLSSARYWPKVRCHEDGTQCEIGDSGGPGQECDHELGCAPPLDTKFEGTFGIAGMPCDVEGGNTDGCDFVDVSLVDGFTVPFKFEILGDCDTKVAADTSKVSRTVDCSTLSVDDCPCDEDLGGAGTGVNLRVVNPATDREVGCYSPCSKLTYSNWNNAMAKGHSPQDGTCAPYCCPTPTESPEACSNGPAGSTRYVDAVHKRCPGVYGYSYDDGMGLLKCPAGTKYIMHFYCPTKSSSRCPADADARSSPAERLRK